MTLLKNMDGVKRTETYNIDPRNIKVVAGWNPRFNFDAVKLEELKNSIISLGVKVPVRVKISDEDEIILIDGERRLRATLMAIEEGHDIPFIPAINEKKNMSEADMLILSLITNTGEKLTPMEEATAIDKLIKMGATKAEVAKSLGSSVQLVNARLMILDADEEILNEYEDGNITLGEMQKITNKSGGDKEEQKKKLEDVKLKKSLPKTSKKDCIELLGDSIEWLVEYKASLTTENGSEELQTLIDRINSVMDE